MWGIAFQIALSDYYNSSSNFLEKNQGLVSPDISMKIVDALSSIGMLEPENGDLSFSIHIASDIQRDVFLIVISSQDRSFCEQYEMAEGASFVKINLCQDKLSNFLKLLDSFPKEDNDLVSKIAKRFALIA